jgi:hypothetical protein
MNRRLGGSQSGSGRGDKEKNYQHLPDVKRILNFWVLLPERQFIAGCVTSSFGKQS